MTTVMAAVFFCLSVVLFLARYGLAMQWQWNQSQTGGGSNPNLAIYMDQIGIAPWVFAACFLVAGIVCLIVSFAEKSP